MDRSLTPAKVYDLPQLHTRPSSDSILEALELLALTPPTFSNSREIANPALQVAPEGVSRYLTSIISSSLSWIKDEEKRERIWDVASIRLSERSGRNAMPSMTRSFQINDHLSIALFEPSLTEDNIGFKTWISSLLLAQRLPHLRCHIPTSCTRILELGAGTGLVGIAAACTWKVDVLLTDLPEIVPNLQKNVESNKAQAQQYSVNMSTRTLDWSDDTCIPLTEVDKFMVIIAADPIYTTDHPKMLVETVDRWLANSEDARFIVELPLREAYKQERDDLGYRLNYANLHITDEGTEIGYDDWQGSDGQPTEVKCWWSVWRRTSINREE